MYNFVQLNKKHLKAMKNLSYLSCKLNSFNLNFWQYYCNLNYIQKFFERKRIKMLQYKDEYIGFIWLKHINMRRYRIQAMYVTPSLNEIECYKYMLNNSRNKAEFTFECEKKGGNFKVLEKVGFEEMDGTIEMCYIIDKNANFHIDKNIAVEKFIEKEEEELRCNIQNEIFMKRGRIPLSVEDILFDEAQNYYYKGGCFFVKYENNHIGYGQIILDSGKLYIVNFGILGFYRGKGIGKSFLHFLLKWATERILKKYILR